MTEPSRPDPAEPFVPAPEAERALAENAAYAATFGGPGGVRQPSRRLAVVACMDSRLTVEEILGLRSGEAHIIRNAGGLATDDAIRSLVISQHLLGTREVIVIEHTGCGLLTFDDADVRAQLAESTGTVVDLPLQPFADLEENLVAQVVRIREHPWILDVPVSGLVFDVETGQLRRVI